MAILGLPNGDASPVLLVIMQNLVTLIGREHRLDRISREMRQAARASGAAAFGAMQITCSDETERECIRAFEHDFIRDLLPTLRMGDRAAFRTANLGARHEWGSIAITEQHFATPESSGTPNAFKLIGVKINSHVSVRSRGEDLHHGPMERYRTESITCGALSFALGDSNLPVAEQIREEFGFEGLDRLAMLRDPAQVAPERRLLCAALVQARLQARRAILEIQDGVPTTPTVYHVVPCVTLNRPDRDTEIPVGLYVADRRRRDGSVNYCGLGDNPARYRIDIALGEHCVSDDQMGETREARDHRLLILEQIGEPHRRLTPQHADHSKIREVHRAVRERRHRDPVVSRLMLRALLLGLAEVHPVVGALLLFGHGVAAIHHAACAHRLAHHQAGADEARDILREVHDQVDQLPPERANEILEMLLRECGPDSAMGKAQSVR